MKKRTVLNLILTLLVVGISVGALVFARVKAEEIMAEKVVPDAETIEQVKAAGKSADASDLLLGVMGQNQEIPVPTPEPTPTPTPEPTAPPEPKIVLGKYTNPDNSSCTLDYQIKLPANAGTNLPVIVYLYGDEHGGIDNYGIAKRAEEIYGAEFPFALIVPSTSQYNWLGWIPETLCKMVRALAEEYNLDLSHVTLTGHGRGGEGVWATVTEDGSLFSSAVPLCAGQEIHGENFKNTAVWAMCGDGWYDRDNYARWMEYMTEEITAAGGEAKYSDVEGCIEGDITYLAYTPEVFDWILAH